MIPCGSSSEKLWSLDNYIDLARQIILKLRIKIVFILGGREKDYRKLINEILDKYSNLAPSFFFIDPFGFKIKLKTLKRIMSVKRSEIILNFMFDSINRFMILKQNEKNMKEL